DGRDRPALARSLRTIARPGWSRSSCTRTLAPDYRSTWMVAIVLHSHARSGLSLDLDGRDRPALARSLRTIARPGWSRSSCTRTLAPDYRSTRMVAIVLHSHARSGLSLHVTADEGLQLDAAQRVLHLHGRGLHEVRRGRQDRS